VVRLCWGLSSRLRFNHLVFILYNTIQCTWLEKIKYNYNYKTKTEQTLTNHIKHNGNYNIVYLRLFTKIIIFVFTKIERPFLCPSVLPDHCSDMWQTTYFKWDKSALQDLKEQVLVCSYFEKGSLWRSRDDVGWYSCCTWFTVLKQERLSPIR